MSIFHSSQSLRNSTISSFSGITIFSVIYTWTFVILHKCFLPILSCRFSHMNTYRCTLFSWMEFISKYKPQFIQLAPFCEDLCSFSHLVLSETKWQWVQSQVEILLQTSSLASGCCPHPLFHLLHFPMHRLSLATPHYMQFPKLCASRLHLPVMSSLPFSVWPTFTPLLKVLKFYFNFGVLPSLSELHAFWKQLLYLPLSQHTQDMRWMKTDI